MQKNNSGACQGPAQDSRALDARRGTNPEALAPRKAAMATGEAPAAGK